MMFLKDELEVDGEIYYHYSLGGKNHCTKFVVVNQIHYYNGVRPTT